jgi:hypothetical protein
MPAKKKTPAKKKSTKPINYIVKPKIPKDPKAPKGVSVFPWFIPDRAQRARTVYRWTPFGAYTCALPRPV